MLNLKGCILGVGLIVLEVGLPHIKPLHVPHFMSKLHTELNAGTEDQSLMAKKVLHTACFSEKVQEENYDTYFRETKKAFSHAYDFPFHLFHEHPPLANTFTVQQ